MDTASSEENYKTMKISIETTQNVIIEYERASIGDRMLAYAIDMSILIAYELIILFLFSQLKVLDNMPLIILFSSVPFLFYDLVSEILLDGQTVGKMVRKIRIVSLEGKEPNIGHYILRWLLRPIDFWICLGGVALISMIMNKKGQRLGDLLASTCVVSTKQKTDFSATIFPEMEEEYTPSFLQADRLTDSDMRLIKAVIANHLKDGSEPPLRMMSEKVKEMLGISSDMPPLLLLQTIVKDYYYITAGY